MRFNLFARNVRYLFPWLGICMALTAHAATNTGSLTVTATIEAACSVSASPMAFEVVLPGVTKDTEAVVSVVCTSGTTYTLDLGDGQNHITTGGTGIQYRRQMASEANRLPYMVFQEVARATEIAATSSLAANNNLLTSTVGNGVIQEKTIFGRIVGAETTTQPAGVYADTVVITVAF
jgi:spore coat protein U-like protein